MLTLLQFRLPFTDSAEDLGAQDTVSALAVSECRSSHIYICACLTGNWLHTTIFKLCILCCTTCSIMFLLCLQIVTIVPKLPSMCLPSCRCSVYIRRNISQWASWSIKALHAFTLYFGALCSSSAKVCGNEHSISMNTFSVLVCSSPLYVFATCM